MLFRLRCRESCLIVALALRRQLTPRGRVVGPKCALQMGELRVLRRRCDPPGWRLQADRPALPMSARPAPDRSALHNVRMIPGASTASPMSAAGAGARRPAGPAPAYPAARPPGGLHRHQLPAVCERQGDRDLVAACASARAGGRVDKVAAASASRALIAAGSPPVSRSLIRRSPGAVVTVTAAWLARGGGASARVTAAGPYASATNRRAVSRSPRATAALARSRVAAWANASGGAVWPVAFRAATRARCCAAVVWSPRAPAASAN